MIFKNKFTRIIFVIALLAIAPITVHDSFSQSQNIYSLFMGKEDIDYYRLFRQVVERVKKDYVEEVSEKELIEAALDGMLMSLDPHSAFLNEKAYNDMRITTRGEFGGLGIEVTMERGFIKVISPYEDAPAFKAGVKIGDYITMVDGKVIKGMTLSEAVEKLRGKPKTKVKVRIHRESTGENLDLTITRDIIRIAPVKAKLVADDVALLKLSTFSDNSSDIVKKEFNKLKSLAKKKKQKIKGVILDLRWNPGGLLDESKAVTDLFLEKGNIVSTQGRLSDSNQVFKSGGKDITSGLPIIVLINGGSASASEIVAGALQDNKRALVVGTKSFGKGSVQTVIPLPGNTAMKLTTSKYFTPSGNSIQAEGITPDILIEEAVVTPVKKSSFGESSESSLVDHLENGNGKNSKKNKKKKPILSARNTAETKDYQLLRAIDLVKGMSLYSKVLSK